MKTIYAVACPFYGDAEANALAAWQHVLDWIDPTGARGDAAEGTRPEGSAELPTGASIRWIITEWGDASVRRLEHLIPPNGSSPSGWRTVVWVCRDKERSWAQVRSGPENRAWVVSAVPYEAGRPQIVSRWLDDLTVVRDGLRLAGAALNYGQNDAASLIDLLLNPRRVLPVVGIATTVIEDVQQPLLNTRDLAYSLAGNAHVVVLDHLCGWAVTKALGRHLSVFHGGLRIWWPGLTPDDNPLHHPLVVGDRVKSDPRRSLNFLTSRVWSAAVDSIGPPTLEAGLLRARSKAATEERIAKLKDELANADSQSDLSDSFLAEFEGQLQENEKLQDQLDESAIIIDELRSSLTDLETGSQPDADDQPPEVDTVHEAVERAAAEASNVVYLTSAFDSAKESEFQNPQLVLEHLRTIQRVAEKWRFDELPGGFKEAFKSEPVMFKPGIGNIAQTKYKTDYEVLYGGSKVMLGPHLRQGTGAVTRILRIYWYEDSATRQLVVGHVGRKLRDVSNP